MKPCEWCGKLTTNTVVVRRGQQYVNAQTTRFRIKVDRRVPACPKCARRVSAQKEQAVIEQGVQLDVFDVIAESEGK